MNEYKLKISRVSADDTVDQNEFSISAVVGVDDDDAHRIRTSNKMLSVNCAVWFGLVTFLFTFWVNSVLWYDLSNYLELTGCRLAATAAAALIPEFGYMLR